MLKKPEPPEHKEAERELRVLWGNKDYLPRVRAAIQHSGNIFKITIKRIPTFLLGAEKRRLAIILRSGRKLVRNYANAKRKYMYRCSLPGCGDMTLNENSAKRALVSH